MSRYFSIIGDYFVQYAKVRLGYRADFLISLVTTTIASVFGLGVVVLLFRRPGGVGGWNYHELLFLYGYSLLPLALFNLLSINIYYFPENYLIQGKFDRVLLRPVHSLVQILFEQFRLEALGDFALGLGIIFYSAPYLHHTFTAVDIAYVAVSALCGAMLYVAIFLMLTCVSFWFEDRAGIIPPIYNMLAFGRYPLDIYSDIIKFFLSWIVPFAFATFYPVAYLLGRVEYQLYGLVWLPLICAAFSIGAVTLWNRGVNRYGSTGS